MPLTPEDVSNKRFTPVRLREGYDMGEVDQFLDEVEAELRRLIRENDDQRRNQSPGGPGERAAEKPGERDTDVTTSADVTDPPIRFVRRFVPPLRLGSITLDTSFLIVLLVVYLLRALVFYIPF